MKTMVLLGALLLSGCATTLDYYQLCDGFVASYERNDRLGSERVVCK